MEVEPKLYRAIMVSSTFTDLEAHRREVIDAINRFGFRPNVMEYSGARSDADVIDTSLEMVRDSAAYLCVIGHKYGQTPVDGDRNPKGLSITELEFNEARKLERPILLFLMADDHSVTKADIESDPKKRKKLDAFRKQAKRVHPGKTTERVYETFKSKDEFAKKAAIAVGQLAVRMNGSGLGIPNREAIARSIDVNPEAEQAEVNDAIEHVAGYPLEHQPTAIVPSKSHITALKADAEAAVAGGDLDKARAAYGEAAQVSRNQAAQTVRTAAELKAAEAGAHLLALDWEAANSAWTEAAAMLAPFDRHAADELAEDASQRLGRHGVLHARAGALRAAIDRRQALAESAGERGEEGEAARLRVSLGNALLSLGERIGGPDGLRLLDQAVAAYRDALTVYARTDMSTEWAITNNNLGYVLKIQGERTGGSEGLRLLNEAVTALRDALSVHTSADTPAAWAMTQNNLGNAFTRQGERATGHYALRLLDEAIMSYRAALTIYTRANMPAEWAGTQNNLGIALHAQSECTDGPDSLRMLDQAVAAYREALTVYTRLDTPVDWATMQNNVGAALSSRGKRTGGAEGLRLLEEAVMAFRDALTVRTRADMPADWAMTQENIGDALELVAETYPDRAREYLLEAEAAFVSALEVYTPEHMAFYHDKATRSLAGVRAKLAALDA